MSMQMQEASTRRIYDIQSKVYDKTFGKLVQRRIARAIEHIDIGDTDKVLDVGVGTGAALQYYPRRGRIYGIDLSGGMLKKAQARIKELGMDHATILQADALHLPFCDDTFDHLFVSHVVTVVSDPYRLIRECQRVLKPGARIVMVNHFQSTNRFIGMVEKWLCPLCTKLGWRSDLPLHDLVSRTGVQVDYRYKLESIDLWETVVITNTKSALRILPMFACSP